LQFRKVEISENKALQGKKKEYTKYLPNGRGQRWEQHLRKQFEKSCWHWSSPVVYYQSALGESGRQIFENWTGKETHYKRQVYLCKKV